MTSAYFEDHPTDPDKVILRKPRLDQGPDYERGFIDGMKYQMQSSVDKAINAMSQPTYYIPSKDQRPWVGLTDEDIDKAWHKVSFASSKGLVELRREYARALQAKLKEKNNV